MTLSINNCACEVTNVNARREQHGEEFAPAFDINCKIKVAAECIKGLVADTDVLYKMLWDENKEQRCLQVKTIAIDAKFENGAVLIKEKFGHETMYSGCKIGKFKLTPHMLKIAELSFQIQYTAKKESDIVDAFRSLCDSDGVQITITANPENKPVKDDKDKQIDAFEGEAA